MRIRTTAPAPAKICRRRTTSLLEGRRGPPPPPPVRRGVELVVFRGEKSSGSSKKDRRPQVLPADRSQIAHVCGIAPRRGGLAGGEREPVAERTQRLDPTTQAVRTIEWDVEAA